MDNLVRRLREVGGLDPAAELCSYAADRIEHLEAALKKISQHDLQAIAIDALRPGERVPMTDSRGRMWKRNEDGNLCLVSQSEYRNLFLLRRKKLTYKAIGNVYRLSYNHVRNLLSRYTRLRRARVLEYLESRNRRGKQ
jgi:hypothetical protein